MYRRNIRTGNIRKADLIWNGEDDYKMSALPRGHCLIINNVKFEMNIFEYRKGSDKDAFEFRKLFRELGFEVTSKRNMTIDEMRNSFKSISRQCDKKHDALVVILLSHGTDVGIYGTDCIEIPHNDILTYFDNKNCRPMVGKPKVFIIQACRGRKADLGIPTFSLKSQAGSQQALSQQSAPTSQHEYKFARWSEGFNGLPTRSDMILCFSCHFRYNSLRNEIDGSWFGSSLAHYIRTESFHRHLVDILNLVSRDIKRMKSNDGYRQVLEVTTIGFDKCLYFNPGYFPIVKQETDSAQTKQELENDKELATKLTVKKEPQTSPDSLNGEPQISSQIVN